MIYTEKRVDEFFAQASNSCLEVHRLYLIDKFNRFYLSNLSNLPRFLPIIKYLVFRNKFLEFMFTENEPLADKEINQIDSSRNNLKIYKSKEDFHFESIFNTNIPNKIIDIVLIGRPDLVHERYIRFSDKRNILRRKLKYRLQKICEHFQSRPDFPIVCLAYRGELSLRGRFPGDDIDLLISCNNETDYQYVKYEINCLAKRLKFNRVDWIEMHLDQPVQKKIPILINAQGSFRLDCYATVAEKELLRIRNESYIEAVWVLGVLSHSKPILNPVYFREYLKRFKFEVKKKLEEELSPHLKTQ